MSAGQVECPYHGNTLMSDGGWLSCGVVGCELSGIGAPLVSSFCLLRACGPGDCQEPGCQCECHAIEARL